MKKPLQLLTNLLAVFLVVALLLQHRQISDLGDKVEELQSRSQGLAKAVGWLGDSVRWLNESTFGLNNDVYGVQRRDSYIGVVSEPILRAQEALGRRVSRLEAKVGR